MSRAQDRCAHGYPARITGTGIGCEDCSRDVQLRLGRAERDRGLARTVNRPAAKWDLSVILNAIESLAATGREFSADDIRPLLPEVGSQVIGAAFGTAARRGLIEAVGYRQSANPTRHASVIRVWRGTGRWTA